MSTREFIALGTSSQAPTRERSHNSYLLRWDGEGFLFDPGEGAQRQLTLAGVAASFVNSICITHLHGDHCLGLAGVIQRLSLDRCSHPVHIYFPESGQHFIDRLCNASIFVPQVQTILHPIPEQSGLRIELRRTESYTLTAHALEHSVPTIGFRLEEHAGLRFLPEKLESAGVRGPGVGELERLGSIEIGGRIIRREDVSVRRRGSVFAFVMDTKPCPGADALAKDADLLVMESTYVSEEQALADNYCHSTAASAAQTALRAGARRLALTHFSQRYPDALQHLADARKIFDNVMVLNDLDRIIIPRRLGEC
jgi:ribonuclease Z